MARMFVRLKTGTSETHYRHLVCHHWRATKAFNKIKEARVFASSPLPSAGWVAAGFDMELQDDAGAGMMR
ncbi:hypothetical protein ACNKHO_15550 [Shigella flexneri]